MHEERGMQMMHEDIIDRRTDHDARSGQYVREGIHKYDVMKGTAAVRRRHNEGSTNVRRNHNERNDA